MTEKTIVNFENVTFFYDGVPALENATFDIEEKEFAAIIGPNGGGKTTMLKLMLGLLEPQSGTVRVFGTAPASARRRVGYVPQQPQFDPAFPVTVADVTLLARLGGKRKLGPFGPDDKSAARSALEAVNLSGLADRPFSTLSIGQSQRALIARAVACEPDLLLLDEPAATLDPSVQNELYELLHGLNQSLTVVIVSHDVGFVSKYVEKVLCVNRTVALHPASEIEGEIASMLFGKMEVRIVDHGQHS
jgi:zinc transport system ATP-binding protein